MDLFTDDKRLALKPVNDFNNLLLAAYGNGPCACIRCCENNGNEKGYEHAHTFEIDGQVVNRRFAQSIPSDVRRALAKAWEAYYQNELPEYGPTDPHAITAFVQDEALQRLYPLLYLTGVITDVQGVPSFSAA
jgi:hypothetical protein